MGLSNSKNNAAPVVPRTTTTTTTTRSTSRITVFKSSCLGSNHHPQVALPGEESESKSRSCQLSAKHYRTDKSQENGDTTSDKEDDWAESSFSAAVTRESSSTSRRSLNAPGRFLSRFSFYPGNLSFRLSRSRSLTSTRAHPGTSTSYAASNDEEHANVSPPLRNRNEAEQGCDIFPACFSGRYLRSRHRHGASNDLQPSASSHDFCGNLHDNPQSHSDHEVLRRRNDIGVDLTTDLFSPVNPVDCDAAGNRHGERRLSAREFTERNVQFSRTLSVGRLRDRVLRRAPVSDLDLYRFQPDGEGRHTGSVTRRRGPGNVTVEVTSENGGSSQPSSYDDEPSSVSVPFYTSLNFARETPSARETRYRDLLERRSNFIERRRRIRSQVRALQRLGSRFQNLSGHERSCILSGQHRVGHCTCRSAGRNVNTNDDATASASISRIVMLAEALFEVLDEIHQQSVALSSRPSLSSIGSVPAPNEAVDSLPLVMFSKPKKKPSDEDAQCYICLVEYEEGDSMRTLPCNHQFHRACVDKWLKEIHRVCPLCRGDICRPESSTERN